MALNRCSLCRTSGHSARTCPTRPDATRVLQLDEALVNIVMRERLDPILRATMRESNVLKSLMISCYLQGAVDALRPEVQRELASPRPMPDSTAIRPKTNSMRSVRLKVSLAPGSISSGPRGGPLIGAGRGARRTPNQATLYISTGGWSGNEDLIGAMQNNAMLWIMTWVSSRRGGHYTFHSILGLDFLASASL